MSESHKEETKYCFMHKFVFDIEEVATDTVLRPGNKKPFVIVPICNQCTELMIQHVKFEKHFNTIIEMYIEECGL